MQEGGYMDADEVEQSLKVIVVMERCKNIPNLNYRWWCWDGDRLFQL